MKPVNISLLPPDIKQKWENSARILARGLKRKQIQNNSKTKSHEGVIG